MIEQRVRKSDSHLSTGHRFYAYDEAGRTLGEYDGNGDAIEEYVYLDGFRPVALVRNIGLTLVPDIYPILTDHLGTPRKVLDDTGTPQWTWDAKDPYGHQMPDQLVGGATFVFNLRFPGQRYDSETGLYHNGFRDYNPATGRYVQADPIGLAGGWNPYAYVGSSPLNGVDPSGLIVNYGNLSANDRPILMRKLGNMAAGSKTFRAMFREIEQSDTTYFLNLRTDEKSEPVFAHAKSSIGNYALRFNPNQLVACGLTDWRAASFESQIAHEVGHAFLTNRHINGHISEFVANSESAAVDIERTVADELNVTSRGTGVALWDKLIHFFGVGKTYAKPKK